LCRAAAAAATAGDDMHGRGSDVAASQRLRYFGGAIHGSGELLVRLLLITVAAAALVATAAIAQTSAPTTATQAPAAAPAKPLDPDDQMVCRRVKETGSLVKSQKTCHTRRQWAYIDDTNQSFSRNFIDDNRTRQSGQ
jgi:hypothetical protein